MIEAEEYANSRAHAGLTFRRRRVLLSSLLITVVLGMAGRALQSQLPVHVYNVTSAVVVLVGCSIVVAFVGYSVGRGWLTRLVVLAGFCFVVAQVLSITEDIAALEGVLILGDGGAYHRTTFRVFDFAGLSLWVIGFFGVVFELSNVRTQLSERSQALTKEMQTNEMATKALRDSEERYRRMVENATDIIFQTDLDGNFIFANTTASRVSGFTFEEIVGKYFLDMIAPEARDEILEIASRQINEKIDTVYMEFPGLCKDGSIVWLGQNASLRYSNGQPIGVQAVARDITERKAAELALKSSEVRYRHLVEAMGVIPWEVDARTMNFTYIGPQVESMLGYPQSAWYENGFWERIVHPEDRDEAREYCRSQTERNRDHELDYRILAADGRVIWFRDIVSVVSENGIPTVLRGIFVDISEIKEAEEERRHLQEQMQHAQKLESLGVLAGGIAHDFNNFLSGIMGNADLALQQEGGSRENLETIVATAKRAGELCQQLLAYSGRGKIVVQPHDLTAIVQEMGDLLELPISKKARLQHLLESGLPAIEGDGTQIRQVIMNLMTNATESIDDASGTIVLTTGTMVVDASSRRDPTLHGDVVSGDYVYFEVTDTGCGMDGRTQARMFDPFYTTKFSGRGLGLAAVLGIMRSHKGAIRVQSAQGEGTSVRLLFPASDKPAPMAPAAFGSNGRWRGEGTILVVDDEPVIRNFVSTVLTGKGFGVVTAEDGVQAVHQFRRHAEELVAVVLDLTMPNMDGAGAYREMRDIREGVPVIVISGFSEIEATQSFAGSSMSAFVQKPFQSFELLDALKDATMRFA